MIVTAARVTHMIVHANVHTHMIVHADVCTHMIVHADVYTCMWRGCTHKFIRLQRSTFMGMTYVLMHASLQLFTRLNPEHFQLNKEHMLF